MPRPQHVVTATALRAHFDGRFFTTADAEAIGVSRARVHSACAAGLVTQLQRGVFAMYADPLARARLHQGRLRDQGVYAVLGERSAAKVWGLWEFGPHGPLSPPPLTLLVPHGVPLRRGTRNGLRYREANLTHDDVVEIDGVAITTPLRTGFDVARALGRGRAAALTPLNSAIRTEIARRTFPAWQPPAFVGTAGCGASVAEPGAAPTAHDITEAARDQWLRQALLVELARLCEEAAGYGTGRVTRVIADVEPLLESWLESVAWSELTVAALPRPQPQAWIMGASGRWRRADFLINSRIVLEVDGAGKYSDQTPWQEKQRQSDLEAAGYWVIRCTWEELLHHPERVIARIVIALDRVG